MLKFISYIDCSEPFRWNAFIADYLSVRKKGRHIFGGSEQLQEKEGFLWKGGLTVGGIALNVLNMWRLVLRLRQADIYLLLPTGGYHEPRLNEQK